MNQASRNRTSRIVRGRSTFQASRFTRNSSVQICRSAGFSTKPASEPVDEEERRLVWSSFVLGSTTQICCRGYSSSSHACRYPARRFGKSGMTRRLACIPAPAVPSKEVHGPCLDESECSKPGASRCIALRLCGLEIREKLGVRI